MGMRTFALLSLLACSSPVAPSPGGPLNARLSYKPGVLTYDLDHASACRITSYVWETGYWKNQWELPPSRGGRIPVRADVETYFHLHCAPVVMGDETNWAVLLVGHE